MKIVLIIALCIWVVIELVGFMDGSPISDLKENTERLKANIQQYTVEHWERTGYYLTAPGDREIKKTIFPSLFFKWKIKGLGRVPRWSEMHSIIETYYDQKVAEKKKTRI